MPLFRRNTEKNSKMCKRDGVTFKVTPPFFNPLSPGGGPKDPQLSKSLNALK